MTHLPDRAGRWWACALALLLASTVAADKPPTEVHVLAGATKAVTLDGKVKSVPAAGPIGVVDIMLTAPSELLFIGLNAGQATLKVALDDGREISLLIVVERRPKEQVLREVTPLLARFPWAALQVEGESVLVRGSAPTALSAERLDEALHDYPDVRKSITKPEETSHPSAEPQWPVGVVPSVIKEAAPTSVDLHIGEVKTYSADFTRIDVGDPSVAAIRFTGEHEVQILGVAPDTTTFIVWLEGGQRLSALLRVVLRNHAQVLPPLTAALAKFPWVVIQADRDPIVVSGKAPTARAAFQVNEILDTFPEVGNGTTHP